MTDLRAGVGKAPTAAVQSGIYEILNLTNGKRYIGQTISFKTRWKGHRTLLRGNRHNSPILQSAWNKYGEAAFIFRPVITCSPKLLTFYEQQLLDKLRPEYNCCTVANSVRGIKRKPFSIEHKRKLAAANTGKKQPREVVEKRAATLRGRACSPETKAKIAARLRGRKRAPFSAQWLARMGIKNTGRKHSQEWRDNISKAHFALAERKTQNAA